MKTFILILSLVATAWAQHLDKRTPGGCIQIPGEEGRMLPLLSTHIQSHIDGVLAQTVLKQTFVNDTSNILELTYIFPMPHRAAVGHYQFTIGERTIVGTIQTKEKARQIYEQARAEGKTAALLEQQRPNIFIQNLTGIPAGASIQVEITYDEVIHTEDGAMEWVLPMVVGPRFMPENASASTLQNPTYSIPSEREANTITLEISMADRGQLGVISSNSHAIQVVRGQKTTITLDKSKTIPNKDFILNFSYRNILPELSFSSYFDAAGSQNNSFLLTLLPPTSKNVARQVLPREFFFILDVSGSMYGQPMDKAIATIKACMSSLRPDDTFQIMTFAGSTSFFRPEPVKPTQSNLNAAMKFLNSRQSGGGTYMMKAIKKALGSARDPERYRMAVMFTDGYIGNEREIIEGIRRLKDSSRLFAFGIGSSVNRYLLEGMGRAGNGFSEIVPLNADLNQTARRWENRLRSPILTDLQLSIKGGQVSDILPAQIPDLFAGEPVLISGHFSKKGKMTVTLTGKRGGKPFELSKTMNLGKNSNPVVPKIWAREKIRDLNFALSQPGQQNERGIIEKEITKLGLSYRLLTAYTSFVAVDSLSKVGTDGRIHADVSVPLPEGVSPTMLGAKGFSKRVRYPAKPSSKYKEKKSDSYIGSLSEPILESAAMEREEIADRVSPHSRDGEADKGTTKSEVSNMPKSPKVSCTLLFKPGMPEAIGLILNLTDKNTVKQMVLVSIDGKTTLKLKPSMIRKKGDGTFHLLFKDLNQLKSGTWILHLAPGKTFQFTI